MKVYPMIGEIRIFAGHQPPDGWAFCNGLLLMIQSCPLLFAVIKNAFGGDGTMTFALPDLRGRIPVGMSSSASLGTRAGSETVALTVDQFPAHKHAMACNNEEGEGTLNNPADAYMGVGPVDIATTAPVNTRYAASSSGALMASDSLSPTGASMPFSVVQPLLTLNYIIATDGAYPPDPGSA